MCPFYPAPPPPGRIVPYRARYMYMLMLSIVGVRLLWMMPVWSEFLPFTPREVRERNVKLHGTQNTEHLRHMHLSDHVFMTRGRHLV